MVSFFFVSVILKTSEFSCRTTAFLLRFVRNRRVCQIEKRIPNTWDSPFNLLIKLAFLISFSKNSNETTFQHKKENIVQSCVALLTSAFGEYPEGIGQPLGQNHTGQGHRVPGSCGTDRLRCSYECEGPLPSL